jgi:hypothetical protein
MTRIAHVLPSISQEDSSSAQKAQWPKPSAILSHYPTWASWNSQEVYLPANFHSRIAFKKALEMVRKDLGDPDLVRGGD